MSALPKCAFNSECVWEFEGYRHGLVQEFFLENYNKKAKRELIDEACEPIKRYKNDSDIPDFLEVDCIHSVGHALMNINENNALLAVQDCDTHFPIGKNNICYSGIFMEEWFLTSVYQQQFEYVNEEYQNFCQQFGDEARSICSIYMALKSIDFKKSAEEVFAQCFMLTKNYSNYCILGASRYYLVQYYSNNLERLPEFCKRFENDSRVYCIIGASGGIRRGASGESHKEFDVCSYLEGENERKECEKTPFELTKYER